MKSNKVTYLITLIFQIIFLIIDITCNVLSDEIIVRSNSFHLLGIYIIQDACILISFTLLGISLFRTYMFKIGYMELLFFRFKTTILFSIVYFILTLVLQISILIARWDDPLKYKWGPGIFIFYTLQRFFAVLYYYFIKRTALRLADPRFYDEEWVKHTLAHRS